LDEETSPVAATDGHMRAVTNLIQIKVGTRIPKLY